MKEWWSKWDYLHYNFFCVLGNSSYTSLILSMAHLLKWQADSGFFCVVWAKLLFLCGGYVKCIGLAWDDINSVCPSPAQSHFECSRSHWKTPQHGFFHTSIVLLGVCVAACFSYVAWSYSAIVAVAWERHTLQHCLLWKTHWKSIWNLSNIMYTDVQLPEKHGGKYTFLFIK